MVLLCRGVAWASPMWIQKCLIYLICYDNNIEIICHGAQKEFLTRISWGITKTLRGTIWLAEQFTVSNPWVGYTNHSFAKIPIRFMT